jgi:REP element-mobilizing transposase RayT
MELPCRTKLPHTVPQWVAEGSWFLITINCLPRARNQLCVEGIGDAVLAAAAYNHEKLFWHCRLCLLMPDHLHAIIGFPRDPGMGKVIANWKRFVAVKVGVNWQRDFFDHRLRSQDEVGEKTGYILQNPVRKRLCERAEDWRWVLRPDDRPPPKLD